jgi:hypothetical protein
LGFTAKAILPPFLFIGRCIVQFYTIQLKIKRNGGSIQQIPYFKHHSINIIKQCCLLFPVPYFTWFTENSLTKARNHDELAEHGAASCLLFSQALFVSHSTNQSKSFSDLSLDKQAANLVVFGL